MKTEQQLIFLFLGLASGLFTGYLLWGNHVDVAALCAGTGNYAAADISFLEGVDPELESRIAGIIADSCLEVSEL